MKSEIKKPNIYIATAFNVTPQIKKVEEIEEALEANPFVGAYFSPMRNELTTVPAGSIEWDKADTTNKIYHLDWADIIVTTVEEYLGDFATGFEVGYALANGKPVIVVNSYESQVYPALSATLYAHLTSAGELEDYNFIKMPKIPVNRGLGTQ